MSTTLQKQTWLPIRGLDDTSPPHRVTMDMASALLNVEIVDGTVKKRDGYEKLTTSQFSATASVLGQSGLDLSNGTSYDLFHLSNGKIVKLNTNVATATALAGFATGEPVYTCQLLDTLIVGQGVTAMRTWDGSVTGIISASPFGKYSVTHLEKIFTAGISGNLSLVSCSGTGDYATWSGAGTADINVSQNDGTVITGMSVLRNELIIFKERSIWKLIGFTAATLQLVNVAQNIGCIGHNTIQNTGDMVIFAFTDGVYIYDGSSVEKISGYQDSTYNLINRTRYRFATSALYTPNKEYILSFPIGSSTVNSIALVYYYDKLWKSEDGRAHAPCVKWTGQNYASLRTSRIGTTKAPILYVGDYTGYVKKRTTDEADDGTAINSYVCSPFFNYIDISQTINLRRAYLPFTSSAGTVDVDWSVNDTESDWTTAEVLDLGASVTGDQIGINFTIGTSAIGSSSGGSNIYRVNFNGVQERRIKVRLLNNSATTTWKLQNPIELFCKARGHKDG